MRVPIMRLGVLLAILVTVAGRPGVVSAQATARSAAPPAGASIRCLVSLIEEVQVPAREQGVLKTLIAKKGHLVVPGQLLAQIDDTRAQMQLLAAQLKLEVAKTQADNTTNVEYARAASRVAKAEYLAALDANKRVLGTIPFAELNRLYLTFQQTEYQIKQAVEDLLIAGLQADVSKAEEDAAADNLQRRKIESPLEGVVVKVHRHQGEWVQAGEPVLDVIRIDQLWIEGFVLAADYPPGAIQIGQPVTVQVALTHDRVETFTGTITFVNPVVTLGGKRLVQATVDNRKEGGHWLLSAGLTAEMTLNRTAPK